MATPTYATVISQINTFIVANANNEITANVLNPVLKVITDFANNTIGNLDNLTTTDKITIVNAINSLKIAFENLNNNGIQLTTGYADPNVTPPSSYNYGDFYMELDNFDDSPIQLWQWSGVEWTTYDSVYSKAEIDLLLSTKLDKNTAIAGATKTKITYDSKGIVTAGADAGISDITGLTDALNNKLETSLKGVANGLAELDAQGFVKNTQLPSYVDDVIEGTLATFPATGETGKIYVDTVTNKTYRWSGTVYASIGSDLALGELDTTAYRGDRGKIAYDHSQLTHDKTFVGLSNVDNTSDANKPVSTAQQTALNLKVDKVTGSSLLADTEITRLLGLSNYTHPATHPPSIIVQDANNRFVTDTEKTNWNTAYGWGNHAGLYLGINAKAADSNLLDGLDSTSFAPASGSANYIQNQNASAQSANMWISGSGTFGSTIQATTAKLISALNYNESLVTGAASGLVINNAGQEIAIGGSGIAPYPNYIQSRVSGIGWALSLNPLGGNVGIGTTSPLSKLQVEGTGKLTWNDGAINTNQMGATVTVGSKSATGGSLFVYTAGQDSSYGSGFGVDGDNFGSVNSVINLKAYGVKYANYISQMAFHTSNGVTLYERMRIDGAGNVGIGYSTGTEITNNKLAVNGSGYFNGTVTAIGNILGANTITNETDTYTATAKVTKMITLSQAEYNAIGTKDANTMYIII